jgi:hypothetical protein
MAGRLAAVVAVPVVVAGVLGLGGCRGAERAALPAPRSTDVPARAGPAAADPLAGIESEVDAVERDVDSDSGAAGGR